MSFVELYPVDDHYGWTGRGSDSSYYHSSSYGRPYQSAIVVLHVSMCCGKCIRKVRKSLRKVDDVESVDVDMQRQKVIVRGYVNPEKVLRKVRKVKKSATFWNSSHDYANYSTGAYDYSPSSSYEHYYTGSPTDGYGYNGYNDDYASSYASSHDYYRHDNHSHHYRSYDAYRYR